jgi:hypothetical protein
MTVDFEDSVSRVVRTGGEEDRVGAQQAAEMLWGMDGW